VHWRGQTALAYVAEGARAVRSSLGEATMPAVADIETVVLAALTRADVLGSQEEVDTVDMRLVEVAVDTEEDKTGELDCSQHMELDVVVVAGVVAEDNDLQLAVVVAEDS
jgi:hypothetical protein